MNIAISKVQNGWVILVVKKSDTGVLSSESYVATDEADVVAVISRVLGTEPPQVMN